MNDIKNGKYELIFASLETFLESHKGSHVKCTVIKSRCLESRFH